MLNLFPFYLNLVLVIVVIVIVIVIVVVGGGGGVLVVVVVVVQSKIMKKAMNPETYDKLILKHHGEVNKHRHIVLMNMVLGFYETQVNFVKNITNLMSI